MQKTVKRTPDGHRAGSVHRFVMVEAGFLVRPGAFAWNLELIIAALLGVRPSACVIAPYPRQAGYYPEPGGMIVSDVAPPAPYAGGRAGRPFRVRSGSVVTGVGRATATAGSRAAGTMVAKATHGTRTAGKTAAVAGICRAAAGAASDLADARSAPSGMAGARCRDLSLGLNDTAGSLERPQRRARLAPPCRRPALPREACGSEARTLMQLTYTSITAAERMWPSRSTRTSNHSGTRQRPRRAARSRAAKRFEPVAIRSGRQAVLERRQGARQGGHGRPRDGARRLAGAVLRRPALQAAGRAAGHRHERQGRHDPRRVRRDERARRAHGELEGADPRRSARTTTCGASTRRCRRPARS